MSSPSIPAAPPPPDYSQATREGITTDISTLPLRAQIQQAARLGTVLNYIDPSTGEQKTADFTGLGDATYAQQAADLASQQNATQAQQQLKLRQELGVANVEQTNKELQAADPTAYKTRQTLEQQILDQLGDKADVISPDSRFGSIYDDATRLPDASRLGALYDEANSRLSGTVKDKTAPAMDAALASAYQDFQKGSALDDQTRTEVEQQLRRRMASTGNDTGPAAAYTEAMGLGSAGEARKQQRLQTLLGTAGQKFGQDTATQQADQAAETNRLGTLSGLDEQGYTRGANKAGLLTSLAQADDANAQQARNETYAKAQQRLANASSMVMGMPITNQFGSLAGAQQGAVGYNPTSYNGAQGLNPAAGQQAATFAAGNYGTASGNWQNSANIAAQGNPWMSLLGNAAGSAAGAGTAAMVAMMM